MNRLALAGLFLLVAGCQGEESLYDNAAKAKARKVAPKLAWNGYGKVLSVDPAKERPECSEAVPFRAGRCLDVLVTSKVPVLDGSGETVPIRTHVYLWLERKRGEWKVRDSRFASPDVMVELKHPSSPDGGSSIAPPWGHRPNLGG